MNNPPKNDTPDKALVERLRKKRPAPFPAKENRIMHEAADRIEELVALAYEEAKNRLRPAHEFQLAIELWFTRDLSETQRRQFCNWLGFPGVEANSLGLQFRVLRHALATLSQPQHGGLVEAKSYADFQQRRGRLPDMIEEAIAIYDGFMLDDNYDAYGCLDKIIAKLKSARDFYDNSAALSNGGSDAE